MPAQYQVRAPSSNGSSRAATDWRTLYRVGAVAAAGAAILTPVAIAAFVAWPPPYDAGAEAWFTLLRNNPLLGLVSLDLLFVVVNVLMLPVMLSLFVALRRSSPAVMTLSIVTFFVGLAAFLSTNPSVEMLSLGRRFADATSETQRIALLGAGEGLLARFEGTAFHLNYILAQLAGIAIGFVILFAGMFSRTTGRLMIAGNALGFGLYIPVVGLGLSAFSGLILWVWMILVAKDLLRLAEVGRADSLLLLDRRSA